mgnify:CR=1 FL=1
MATETDEEDREKPSFEGQKVFKGDFDEDGSNADEE